MKLVEYQYLFPNVPTKNQGRYQMIFLVKLIGTHPRKESVKISDASWLINQNDANAACFFFIFTFKCSFVPISIAMCVSRRRRMFEDGDNVLSDVACVLRPSAGPKMCPGWLKSALFLNESSTSKCFSMYEYNNYEVKKNFEKGQQKRWENTLAQMLIQLSRKYNFELIFFSNEIYSNIL